MLSNFLEGSLPGQDPSTSYVTGNTDVSSFDDLYSDAITVEACCLISAHEPGWAPGGTRRIFQQYPLYRIEETDHADCCSLRKAKGGLLESLYGRRSPMQIEGYLMGLRLSHYH